MDRAELANVLRAARARIFPEEVGLSVDYVVRLEQGRAPRPSIQVLTALTQALRLDRDERDQVFRLAGSAPPLAGRIEMSVRPSVLRLLQRMTDLPALVLSAKGDVLEQNPMARALIGDLSSWPRGERNLFWQRFIGSGDTRVVLTPEEVESTEQHAVGSLRTALSRYPSDPDVRGLIDELMAGSPRFQSMWQQGTSTTWRASRKTFDHPTLGLLVTPCCCLTPTSR